jgi:hypothetical protein
MAFVVEHHYKDGSVELFRGDRIQKHRRTIAIVTSHGVREVPRRGATLRDDGIRVSRSRDGEVH